MDKSISFSIKIILLSFILSSCKLSYRVLLGVDLTPKWKSTEEIDRDFKKNKIPKNQRFILDTSSYYISVKKDVKEKLNTVNNDTTIKDSVEIKQIIHQYKNDLQPVQVRYFTKTGEPVFKMVNCYVQMFPIKWNVNDCFNSFPPKPVPDLIKDNNQNIKFFLPHITNLQGDSIKFNDLPDSDYYAIVFWNYFMKRPSKKLIKQIKKYNNQYPNQDTYFLFVNNHNAEIWNKIDKEQKDKIISYLNNL